ncbi:hypothetical protein BJX99DRAFT_64247 [Aspergillus californicus]
MHTSAILSLALALTSHAFPLASPSSSITAQRRSSDYNVVNVGGLPNPPQPAPTAVPGETVIETVTAPGSPPQTVTVTTTVTPTTTPSSLSALWATSASPSATPTPTSVPGETIPSGFTAMDRLARAFGRSIESHLKGRNLNVTTSGLVARGNETAYSQLSARGVNVTDNALVARGLFNGTGTGTTGYKARGFNGTIFKA